MRTKTSWSLHFTIDRYEKVIPGIRFNQKNFSTLASWCSVYQTPSAPPCPPFQWGTRESIEGNFKRIIYKLSYLDTWKRYFA